MIQIKLNSKQPPAQNERVRYGLLMKNICKPQLSQKEKASIIRKLNMSGMMQYYDSHKQYFYGRDEIRKDIMERSNKKMNAYSKKLAIEYRVCRDILKLAKKTCYPPVALFKIILKGHGLSDEKIDQVLEKPKSYLRVRDYMQLMLAVYFDSVEPMPYEKHIERKSFDKYMKKITDMLDNNGAKYRIEDNVIILDSIIKINEDEVKWIVPKNYYATHVDYMKKLLNDQATKLEGKYGGKGAFLFSKGYSLTIPDTNGNKFYKF